MSRIGKLPINIPAGVTVTLNNGVVTVKGPKGELSQKVDSSINVKVEDAQVVLDINEESAQKIAKTRQSDVLTISSFYRTLHQKCSFTYPSWVQWGKFVSKWHIIHFPANLVKQQLTDEQLDRLELA